MSEQNEIPGRYACREPVALALAQGVPGSRMMKLPAKTGSEGFESGNVRIPPSHEHDPATIQ
jgi:hypothetical protein